MIVERLRQFAIELGASDVGPVIELTGNQAQVIRSDAEYVVMFAATIPNATSEGSPQRYGLVNVLEETSWTWNGIVRVSSFKEIGRMMVAAAKHGIEVRTAFTGMTMSFILNADGEIVTDQRYGFDLENF